LYQTHTSEPGLATAPTNLEVYVEYRGADKFLSRPDWKKQLKGRHFSSDTEVTAAMETWLDGRTSEMFLSGLQKLEFGYCSLFPSWSDSGLISTPVLPSHQRTTNLGRTIPQDGIRNTCSPYSAYRFCQFRNKGCHL